MLAISKPYQRTLALLFVAGLLTIAPIASQSPQPVATPAAAVAPVVQQSIPVTGAPASRGLAPAILQTNADANVRAQRQPEQQQQQQAQPSANLGTEERIQWPMVDVDRQRNKSTVDVHVPIFFDMVNHKDDEKGKSKLDLSVLQGLVTVNRDKERDASGQLTGPMKVTVLGIPVYTSKGLAPPVGPASSSRAGANGPLAAAQRDLDNTLAQVNQTLTRKAEDIVAQVTENTRRANDKMLRSLSDIFDRFSSVMRATTNRVSSTASSIVSTQQQQQDMQNNKKPELEKLGENVMITNGNRAPGERATNDLRA